MEAASGPRLARIGAFGPPRLDFKWVIIGACVALTLYLGVMPLGFLLWQSFFTPQSADKPEIHGGFALAHWNGTREVEERTKEDLKVTIRCIPTVLASVLSIFERNREGRKSVY